MMATKTGPLGSWIWTVAMMAVLAVLAGCSGTTQQPVETATGVPTREATRSVDADGAVVTIVATRAATARPVAVTPLPSEQAVGPVRLEIPEIGLDVPVLAMGWRVVMENGRRTTVWEMPEAQAGWHMDSAGTGAAGNVVISGRQLGDNAPFTLLAVGRVAVGQEVLLTDGDGVTFVYRVVEVSAPIPYVDASAEEIAKADAYAAPTDEARLTLVTGWPDYTTTHLVFAVAELAGVID